MPNRHEPITKAMILHWAKIAKTAHPDSFIAAVYDWMVVGKYAGFWKSKWLQDAAKYKCSGNYMRNIDGTVKAFVLADFKFRDACNRKISVKRKTNSAHQASIWWHFQKNNDNGQTVAYNKNVKDLRMCAVSAACRIYERVVRLKILGNVPIAVYTHNKQVIHMTQREVEVELQSCAKKCLS